MNFDIVIRSGLVVDGSGKPGKTTDVGITGDRITAVGRLEAAAAEKVIDATGKVVCPGFIDPHVHSEMDLLQGRHTAGIRMGVTTQLLAPDGLSYAPLSPSRLTEYRFYIRGIYGDPDVGWDWTSLADYLARFEGRCHNNVVPQVAHGAVRLQVMGWMSRPAGKEELDRMADLTRRCMEEGAVGLCSGMPYLPMAYADTGELIALGKTIAEFNGVYASHIRDYRDRRAESIGEMAAVAEQAGIGVHVSHFSGTPEIYAAADEAGDSGVDITWDAYPYLAGCTLLAYFLPLDVQEGGLRETLKRLTESQTRAKVRTFYEANLAALKPARFAGVIRSKNKHLEGQSLAEAWRASGKSLEDFVCDLLVEEELAVIMVFHRTMDQESGEMMLRHTLTHPRQMVGTDGVFAGGKPHPRGYGTYPRILGRYVRDKNWLSLEQAIWKMTGFPAQRFHLKDRGLIKTELAADITVFDPLTIIDRNSYDDPVLPPSGIEHVFVNGSAAVADGRVTGVRAGRVVKP